METIENTTKNQRSARRSGSEERLAEPSFSEILNRDGYILNCNPIADGKIHRVDVQGDKKGTKNGWYVFFDDGVPSGAYGSWKNGEKKKWCSRSVDSLSKIDREIYKQNMARARQIKESAQAKEHAAVAKKVTELINTLSLADPSHSYLVKKSIEPCGVLQKDKNLFIPVSNVNGSIMSAQTIDGKGDKLFLKGGKVTGGMYSIGTPSDDCYLCEGFATGATIYQATESYVVVTFTAGNLMPVADDLIAKDPSMKITICADDDRWKGVNTGITKANEVAKKHPSNCVVISPVFNDTSTKPTDFNDLLLLEGINAVRSILTEYPEQALVDESEINPISGGERATRWEKWLDHLKGKKSEEEIESAKSIIEQALVDEPEIFDEPEIDPIMGHPEGKKSEEEIESAKSIIEQALVDAKTDPGAVYEQPVIDALKLVRKASQADYLRYRYQIKNAHKGILIVELDKLVKASGEDGESEVSTHLDFANRVIEQIGKDNILYANGTFWGWYETGVWKMADDREVKSEIHQVVEENDPTKNLVESVLDLTKTECFQPRHQFDLDGKTINTPTGELLFKDGVWTVQPHIREHYRTTQIPVEYNPQAQAPRFKRFLNEVFQGDNDSEQKQLVITELIGYSLLSTTHLEKFALLIGGGANGKSVFLGLVEALVGRENVAAVQPSQFENRFQRAHLQGKLVNIVTEIAEGAEIHDAQLKSIVSGELTTAEHKHKPPFDFKPFCTCLFGTNHMPHTRDFSEALFRRAIIIQFNNKFEGSACDVDLKEKLLEELPGILNLALEGAARLLTKKAFTVIPSSETAKKKWRVEADQAAQFVEDSCVMQAGAEETSQKVWHAYIDWAGGEGIKRTLNRNNLTSRLERLGVTKKKGFGGARMLSGIKLIAPS